MGSELLEDSDPTEATTRTEMFEEAFPYYLSLGMTYEQFFYGDPWLAHFYREASKKRIEQENFYAWLHGSYVYEGLLVSLARVIGGKKDVNYTEKPYELWEDVDKKIESLETEADAWLLSIQQRFKD